MPKTQLVTFNKTILPLISSASLSEHLVSQTRSQEVILESFFFLPCHIQSITKFFEFFSLNMFTVTPTSTPPTLLPYFRPSSNPNCKFITASLLVAFPLAMSSVPHQIVILLWEHVSWDLSFWFINLVTSLPFSTSLMVTYHSTLPKLLCMAYKALCDPAPCLFSRQS